MKRILFSVMTCGLIALIAWGALRYAPPIPKLFDQQDKLEHFLAFAALALWVTATLGAKNILKAIVFSVIAAIALEIAQGAFSSTRSGSVFDAIASLSGIACSGIFMLIVLDKVRSRRQTLQAA